MLPPFLQILFEKARAIQARIGLPEPSDPRVLKAAQKIVKEKVAIPVLYGNRLKILDLQKEHQLDLNGVEIIDFTEKEKESEFKDLAYQFYELRKSKGITFFEAQKIMASPLYQATMHLKTGVLAGVVSGSLSPTADVIRSAVQIVKTAPGVPVVSGCFLMASPDETLGHKGLFLFADCGVNPAPTSEELGAIAVSSAQSARSLLGFEPLVAMLSFSSKGSAKHERVDHVLKALAAAKKLAPELKIDGELQLDAAIIPEIGASKARGSEVAGKANVLIFPDLDSGNIGYKLVQRFGKAMALGPILQGLKLPMNDLSRGCSVEDILQVVAITAAQAGSKPLKL